MITLAALVFWLSVALVFHSYVLYPVLLKLFSTGKRENDVVFRAFDTELPMVYVVFSVFNEQKVIKEKLESILNTSYPEDKLRVYIGSDNSTDSTNSIVDGFASRYPQIRFSKFTERNGKSGVINRLMAELNQSSGRSGSKKTLKKLPPNVDLTAMVDLAFLHWSATCWSILLFFVGHLKENIFSLLGAVH